MMNTPIPQPDLDDELPRAVQNGMSLEEYAVWMWSSKLPKHKTDEPYTITATVSELCQLLTTHTEKAVIAAEERTHRIYKKELASWKRLTETYQERDQLKIEPQPMVIQVNPKSHTYLIGDTQATTPKGGEDE